MIILLNGPPGSGKDTIGNIIARLVPSCVKYKMSHPLKKALQVLLGIDDRLWATYLSSDWKDEPFDIFPSTTPRQALIKLSEEFVKPLFGNDFFGHLTVQAIQKLASRHVVITDTGFTDEVKPILDHYRPANVRIIQIHRPGHGYTEDSRDYVNIDMLGMQPHWTTIVNEHDLHLLEAQVKRIMAKWDLLLP